MTTTTTKNPDAQVRGFNKRVNLIYGNPEYNTLDADTRHKLDSVFYDKVVSKYYKNVAQQPPPKDVWMKIDRETKQRYAQDFKPSPLVNWVSSEEKAPDKSPPEMTSGQRAKYYSAKILDSTLKYVNTLAGVSDKIDKAFGFLESDEQKEYYGKQRTQLKESQEKLNQYFASVEPQVQHDLRTKIFGASAGFIPDLALFKGVGEGLKPFIGELEAGKISGDSLLAKVGGITKLLESTPVGRTAYRLMDGALQGFAVDMAQDDVHKAVSDAPSWGIFNAALPAVAKLAASPFKASIKLYSEMATHTGAEFVIQNMANTAARIEKGVTEPIKDELIAKLDKANLETLNKAAKDKYQKLYYFLTPEQKKNVSLQVRDILHESFNNPASHATTATVIDTNKKVLEQAASDPIFAKQAQKMKEATQKVTGHDVLQGPAKEVKKQTEYIGNAYGTNYIANKPKFQVSRGPDKGQVSVTFPDAEHADLYAYLGRMRKQMSGGISKGPSSAQLSDRLGIKNLAEASKKYREQINTGIKNLEEGTKYEAPKFRELPTSENKNKIVPGAASGQSPEFLNNLLAQYQSSVGFENPKHKILAMLAQKDSYPPQIAQRIQEEVDEMYKGFTQKQVQARLNFLKKHVGKLEATWEINPQGDKKRVFRSTGLTNQSKTEWQHELDELYDSTFGEK